MWSLQTFFSPLWWWWRLRLFCEVIYFQLCRVLIEIAKFYYFSLVAITMSVWYKVNCCPLCCTVTRNLLFIAALSLGMCVNNGSDEVSVLFCITVTIFHVKWQHDLFSITSFVTNCKHLFELVRHWLSPTKNLLHAIFFA